MTYEYVQTIVLDTFPSILLALYCSGLASPWIDRAIAASGGECFRTARSGGWSQKHNPFSEGIPSFWKTAYIKNEFKHRAVYLNDGGSELSRTMNRKSEIDNVSEGDFSQTRILAT
jgi:hypothetical protein